MNTFFYEINVLFTTLISLHVLQTNMQTLKTWTHIVSIVYNDKMTWEI